MLHTPQIKHGEVFKTETDTEVIPKLCKFVYDRLGERVPFPKVGSGWWGRWLGLEGCNGRYRSVVAE